MSANGRLTPAELTYVGNGQYLSNGTAQAFFRMSAATQAATGVSLTVSDGGGYRDLAAQQYLIDHPQGPVPIAPLGYSTHGDGRAVDIRNAASLYVWLKKHAAEFSFYQQFSSEPWHWRFTGAETAGTSGTPIEEEDLMPMKIIGPYGLPDKAVVGGGLAYAFPTLGEFQHFLNLNGLGTPDTVPVTVVGDAGMTEAARRDVFQTLIRIYGGGTVPLSAQQIAVEVAKIIPAAAGGTADNAPVLAAVASVAGQVTNLDTKVTAFPSPPTVEAITKAVNDDAAQRLAN